MNRAFALGLGIPLVVVGLVVVMFVFFGKDASPQVESSEQQRIIEMVSQHFLIPINSYPVVSRLSDTETLKEQQDFYLPASDGDYLILLVQARKAIIYSEEKDILLNVGPIVSP